SAPPRGGDSLPEQVPTANARARDGPMYLTASNLAYYLIHRDLIVPEAVLRDGFTVLEAGRRNRNFKVLRHPSPGLFVKQAASTGPEAVTPLQREAAFYGLVMSQPFLGSLAGLVPRLIDYNPATVTLVVELVADGESLAEYHFRTGALPERLGALL